MTSGDEVRWIVLASDGRHVTLGRHRIPDEADLVRASEGLERGGLTGWLARMKGDYYGATPPVLERIRLLTGQEDDWGSAARSFETMRLATIR